MLTFPDFQNVFSLSDVTSQSTPIPNLERRTASAGIDKCIVEQINPVENISISSMNLELINIKQLQVSLKGISSNDQSQQFILQDFTKYDSTNMYKSVAIIDTDEEEDS